MGRTSFLAVAFLLATVLPAPLHAAYLYPGSAAFQPLAVIEPVAEGSLFRTFAPVDPVSAWSLGASWDAYRVREDSIDKDVIASVTAAWSPAPRWLAGLTLPYIARDPDLNESGLLDARLFLRRLLFQSDTGFRLGGEISVIAPTAGSGDLYPLSLETTVIGGRVAASTAAGRTTLGINAGYQAYLESEEGSDSDLLYGLFAEHPFTDRFAGVVEYAGSSHSHSGSGEESVSDDYLTLGARYRFASGYRLGVGAAMGSGDSFADGRFLATFYVPLGGGRAAAKPAAPKAAQPAAPKAAPAAVAAARQPRVQVRVRNASGVEGLGRKASEALKERGYSVVGVSDPDAITRKRTVVLYPKGMVDQALSLARALNQSRVVRDVQLNEAAADAAPGVLVLLIGSDQK